MNYDRKDVPHLADEYVLGLLDAVEAREIEDAMKRDPELKAASRQAGIGSCHSTRAWLLNRSAKTSGGASSLLCPVKTIAPLTGQSQTTTV